MERPDGISLEMLGEAHCTLCYKSSDDLYFHCANSTVLFATWFDSGEFTLFGRELQFVAKCAFFVLFLAQIFICAILYAFSNSDEDKPQVVQA